MQRGVSTAERVGIRAVFQQHRGDGSMAAVGREHESADAIRLRVVRVGPRLQQQRRRVDVANPRREQQRRGPTPQHRVVQLFASRALRLFANDGLSVGEGTGANVGAGLDQLLNDRGMALRDRPHQRALPMLVLLRVHLRAASDQRLHRLRLAGAGAGH